MIAHVTHISEPEPRCPHCNAELEGWEPPSEDYNTWGIPVLSIVNVFTFIVSLIIFMDWIGSSRTLLQTIIDAWHWFVGLSHRIY